MRTWFFVLASVCLAALPVSQIQAEDKFEQIHVTRNHSQLERKIYEGLETETSFDFEEFPLEDVLT